MNKGLRQIPETLVFNHSKLKNYLLELYIARISVAVKAL